MTPQRPHLPLRRPLLAALIMAGGLALAGALAMPSASHASLGATWTARTLPSGAATKPWVSVAHGGGQFVAIAGCYGTTDCVMTSPDGFTWTLQTDTDANGWSWASVAYGNGRFVAVSNVSNPDSQAMTSTDGVNWTSASLDSTQKQRSWTSVAYGNGRFVAVSYTPGSGNTDQARVMWSTDGINWTSVNTPSTPNPTAGISWEAVAYGNGTFTAINSSNTSMYSTDDGASWTTRVMPSRSWKGLTWGGAAGQEKFVAVGLYNVGGNTVVTNPDPSTTSWTSRAPATNNDWYGVAYGAGVFVATSISAYSHGSISDRVMTSPDGITWTPQAAAEDNNWQRVAYGDGRFVAVSGNGTNRVMTSGPIPDAPATPTATAGDTEATVTVAQGSGSGPAPTSYLVTASPGGAVCTVTAPATSCTVTGLANGTAYTFAATATSQGGTSAASSASVPVTPSAPAPTPAPTPTPSPAQPSASAGSASAEIPTGGSTPSTPSTPTLAVRNVAASHQALSTTITSRVVVSGAGTVRQVGTRTAGQSARSVWGATAHADAAVLCTASRKAPRAGSYRMTCTLGAATRAELALHAVTLRLVTTFTPTGGTPIARTTSVVVARIPASRPRVTG